MSNNSMTKIFDKVKFFDKVKILPGGISNSPTYSLQRSVSPVEGGGSEITFTVNTTNVADGTVLPYTISNISPADVTSGSLTGSFTVASNTASTTLGVSLEPTSPGVGSASLALNNGAASISVFPAPTYSLTRSVASVDEGSSITFTLTTTGVANGTSVPYVISGISAGDLSSGSLTGNFVVNNGSATVTVTLANDALTEGTETISITAQGASTSASVNDLTPTYTLSRSAASINEGSSVTFTLTTTNVANGTSIPYTITGISAEDLSSGSLSGNFVINNGSATVTLTAASDALTEGTETITITAASQSTTTSIVDNSFNPVTGPAETVLLLAGDGTEGANNSGFADGSSNNFTITATGAAATATFSPFGTGTSAYFDGSTGHLTAPNSNEFVLGTGDATIEFWVYTLRLQNYDVIFSNRVNANDGDIVIHTDSNGSLYYYESGQLLNSGSNVLVANTWTHVALVRTSGTRKLYVNGIKVGPDAAVTNVTSNNLTLGRDVLGSASRLNGYLSNFRYVKGTALYTSNFSLPTAPPTNISGTSLLLNTAAPGIVDSTNKNPVITTFGNTAISTSVKKYGTGSMYFDGSGDYLIPDSNLALGAGDFTIEFWMNPASSASGAILDTRSPSDNTGSFDIYTANSNIRFGRAGASYILGSSTLTIGVWYHIAITRSGNTFKLFVDGSQDGATYTNSGLNFASTPLRIGIGLNGGFNGYIDDLRITKNLARYTSNFTPPTGPLTIDI